MHWLGVAAVIAAMFATAINVPARAQPSRVPRIGIVSPTASAFGTVDAFRQHLRELGHVEGQNVIVEQRFAEGRADRLPDFVAEMIRLKVDVSSVPPSARSPRNAPQAQCRSFLLACQIPLVRASSPVSRARGAT